MKSNSNELPISVPLSFFLSIDICSLLSENMVE